MLVSEFDYELPAKAVAQRPLKDRDRSRLLVVVRKSGELRDQKFAELPELLSPPDALVINNCKVIPARLFGIRGTNAKLEITFIEKKSGGLWLCLVKGKKPRAGEKVELGKGGLLFEKEMPLDEAAGFLGGLWQARFIGVGEQVLDEMGVAPLPPYLKRRSPVEYGADLKRYQTVYARKRGAVAAPTAGLHFTERVIRRIRDKGVAMPEITLFVGFGTFAPVRVKNIEDHRMHSEEFEVGAAAAEEINQAREKGGRVIAVGTTVARALEEVSTGEGKIPAAEGETDLFITPGFKFKAVDALLTNFHLPRSTLLMLVCAFAGMELVKKAYAHALQAGYRFLSYGDCMLIL